MGSAIDTRIFVGGNAITISVAVSDVCVEVGIGVRSKTSYQDGPCATIYTALDFIAVFGSCTIKPVNSKAGFIPTFINATF